MACLLFGVTKHSQSHTQGALPFCNQPELREMALWQHGLPESAHMAWLVKESTTAQPQTLAGLPNPRGSP